MTALRSGQRLGPYEILAPLGAGGMGEVYRARDERLRREIALKVLPASFSDDAERLARFEREAQLLASLNHPNVGTIHGFEEAQGVRFLVLELVPGQTLSERLSEGPIPIDEALGIARQIAEALAAAHESGIVHRDLKPANVKVTPAGKVKVLDFGLAKAFSAKGTSGEQSHSPTITAGATRDGVILGTAAYMSPEQARGRQADKRTDIWAFGCVVYELLTGRRAFTGETVSDTLAGILRSEPDWSTLPADCPAPVRRLLRRCLQKDAARRLHDIADARLEIEEALAGAPTEGGPVVQEVPASRRKRGIPLPWLAAGLLLGAAAGALFTRDRATAPAPSVPKMRFTVALPPEERFPEDLSSLVAMSPSGRTLVLCATNGSRSGLFVRSLDELDLRLLPGTNGARVPFFAPDGQSVGFFSEGRLKKISLAGGAPVVLADAPVGTGGAWSEDGTIYFTPVFGSPVLRIPANGGTAQPVTRVALNGGEAGHPWPEALPGERGILYTVEVDGKSHDDARIFVQPIGAGEPRLLIDGGSNPHYLPTGHIVYARAGSIYAVPFDLDRLKVEGDPVEVVQGVLTDPSSGAGHFSVSRNGTLAYVPGGIWQRNAQLVRLDRQGRGGPLPAPHRRYYQPRFSPDGTRLSVGITGANDDIWIMDVARGVLTRMTFEKENLAAIWTPDGSRLTFSSHLEGPPLLYWMPSDGSGGKESLLSGGGSGDFAASWAPSGKVLLFGRHERGSNWDVWQLTPGQPSSARPVLNTRFNEMQAAFSPDGRWLSYVSDESGRDEVYVVPYPGPGGKRQVSTEGGTEPVWARSGRELFYRQGRKMMAAAIRTPDQSIAAAPPRTLFEDEYVPAIFFGPNYDVTPDGADFIMVRKLEESPARHVHVVTGWFDEVQRRVPAGGRPGT